jgi:hypothetical protein
MRFSTVIAASIVLSLGGAVARGANVYLVGAQVYASGASGQNVGAYSGTPYQFSTNSNTAHDSLDVNGTSLTISFALSDGPNVFTFTPGTTGFPINTIGLNLFFDGDGTSYNPAYTAGGGIPGDLSAFVAAGSSAFAIPAAGINVQSYNTDDLKVNSTSYSGATSFEVGNSLVTLTAFSATVDPAGSFTLTVSEVPEPGTIALLGIGLGLVALFRRRT